MSKSSELYALRHSFSGDSTVATHHRSGDSEGDGLERWEFIASVQSAEADLIDEEERAEQRIAKRKFAQLLGLYLKKILSPNEFKFLAACMRAPDKTPYAIGRSLGIDYKPTIAAITAKHKENLPKLAKLMRAYGYAYQRGLVLMPHWESYLFWREYMRQYWAAHRDEFNVKRRKNYAEHREEIRTKDREYRASRRVEITAKARAYYATHKEEMRAYNRKYYKENSDKHKAIMQKYYLTNREQIRAKQNVYQQEHKDELKQYATAYRLAHRDKIREQQRQYCLTHRDKIREQQRRYYLAHRDEINERLRQRRALLKAEAIKAAQAKEQTHNEA